MTTKLFTVLPISLGFLLVFSLFNSPDPDLHARVQIAEGQYTYSYENEIISYSDVQKLYSNDTSAERKLFWGNNNLQSFQIHISAIVKQTFFQSDANGYSAVFDIFATKITTDGDINLVDTSTLVKGFKQPIFVEYNGNGKIKFVRIDTSISFLCERFVKDLISHFQFIKNQNEHTEWFTNEDNVNGECKVKYNLLEMKDGFFSYNRKRLAYTKLPLAEKSQKIEIESIGNLTVDSNYIINNGKVSEVEYSIFGSDTISASGSKYSINLISHNTVGDSLRNHLVMLSQGRAFSKKSTLSAAHTKEEIRRLAYANTLNDETFISLKEKLKTTLDSASENKLTLQFRALGYLFPNECYAMGNLLEEKIFGSQSYRVLVTSLSQVGNAAAINALSQVLHKRKKEDKLVIDLLPIFAIYKTPTAESVSIIQEFAFDTSATSFIRSMAQLSLGGISYNLRKISLDESEIIVRTLYESLYLGTDSLQKILCLGNTGSPNVFSFLKSISTDTLVSSKIRGYSVYSMKLIESDSVTIFLSQFQNYPDSIISKSAKDAIMFRNQHFSTE